MDLRKEHSIETIITLRKVHRSTVTHLCKHSKSQISCRNSIKTQTTETRLVIHQLHKILHTLLKQKTSRHHAFFARSLPCLKCTALPSHHEEEK